MNLLKKILNSLFKRGITVGYSDGKKFDPRDQVRTDPIKDMVKADKKKEKKDGI